MSMHTLTRAQPRAAHRSPQPPAHRPRVLPGRRADRGAILIHATQAAILGAVAILIVLGASTLTGRTHHHAAPIPPCTTDDGTGPLPCHWDAHVQGNGRGASFTVHTDGTITVDH